MNVYSVAYGIGAAILIYMTYRVYTSAQKTEPKIYFTLLSTVAAIWITSEFLYYTLWGTASLVFYYMKYIGVILTPYAILMTALTIPMRSKIMKFRYTPFLILAPDLVSLAALFTDPFHHLFFSSFQEVDVGDGLLRYTGHWGPLAAYWHVPYSYICLLWALLVIILNLRKSKAKLDYYFLATLFVAIVVPVIMNVILISLWNIYPDPTSLTMVFSAGLITYVFTKYKLFRLPQELQLQSNISISDVESGKSYIIHGMGYSFLKRIVGAKPLLVISTRSPRWISKYIEKENIPVIWLSEVNAENAILPERLEFEIEYTIIEFWRQNSGGVVFLDGIAYMKAFNSFDRLMLFMKDIIDVSSQYDGSVILLGTDLAFLDDNERQKIEALFDEKMTIEDAVPYKIFQLRNDFKIPDAFCVSAENPEKCSEIKDKIWVRRGSEYSPETMRMEVLYEIEHAFAEGKNLVLNRPDGLFIGWKPMKIYTYLKLLADLAEKNRKKVYITGDVITGGLRRILAMFL